MAGDDDDDTTPDPPFKNVPRRPRSAPAPDPGGISSVSNNASPPPATTSVASNNKRPASSSRGGAAEHVPRAKKQHRLAVPMEDHRVGALDRRGVVVGGMPPALSHKDRAASSASSSEAEPAAVDWAENERCRRRKGKTPVVNEDAGDAACEPVARRPPAAGPGHGKLLGDAITAAMAGSLKPKPPSRTTTKLENNPLTKPKKKPPAKKDRTKAKKKEKDSGAWFWSVTWGDGMSPAGSDVDHSFDRIAVASDALRATLGGLAVAVAGAGAPVRLYGRLLTRCDRDIQQARLLMSSKRWRADGAEFPVCAFLTEAEKAAAHGEGLPVTAYDRGGAAYSLTFRFLECNVAYRLITKWSDFLRHNGLDVGKDEPAPVGDDVMIDLWLFRSPAPEGKLGMVMLHYRRGDAAHADVVLDELEHKRLQLNNGAAAAAADAAGMMVEVVAPSSPSEPSGGGATEVAEDQAGPSSSELHGGAGRSDEVTAPLLSLGGGGDGTEEEEQEAGGNGAEEEAGGARMVMVLEVEAAATQSSLDSNAGAGAANEVGEPPSSPEAAGGGGVAMTATEEEEGDEELAEADACSWNVTKYEFRAAQGLMMLSEANSD